MKEYNHIQKQDKVVYKAILGEEQREREGLELIPSENYVSRAVREANGSIFTNKYSEGYPGRRYYGGHKYTDIVEKIAIERACKLFKAKFANVQPHSGAPANIIVYSALLNPGDTVLGMDLSHGGYLTHGHPVTFSAKIYNFVRYKMKNPETGEIDYEQLRQTALKEKPKIILAGFSAYSRELDYKKFVEIGKEVGAVTMADMSHIAGLIAGGAVKNPFDCGFDIITTTTHKTLRGPRAAMIFCKKEHASAIDKAIFPGLQGGPHENTIAAIAVALKEAHTGEFRIYAEQIVKNAQALATSLAELGYTIVAGKTENHLLLVDLTSKKITGQLAQDRLGAVGITVNKNTIPHEPRSPFDPSGIRLGTPAVTTRGMKEDQLRQIARFIDEAIADPHAAPSLKKQVANFAQKFPLFQWSK